MPIAIYWCSPTRLKPRCRAELLRRPAGVEQPRRRGPELFPWVTVFGDCGDWDSFRGYLQMLLEDAALRASFRDNLRHAAVRGWDRTLADFRAACETMLQSGALR